MMIDKELLERIEKKTFTDYEAYDVVGGDDDKTYVRGEMVESILEDLLLEIEKIEEDLEDAKRPQEPEEFYYKELII